MLGPLAGTAAVADRLRLDALYGSGAEPHHPWTTALLAEHALFARTSSTVVTASTTPMRMVTQLRLERAMRVLRQRIGL